MEKKNYLFILLLLGVIIISISCILLNSSFNDVGKLTIKLDTSIEVDSILELQDCLPIEVSKEGYCDYTDNGSATHYFNTNALSAMYSLDTSNRILIFEPWFAYAYKEKNKSIKIQIHNGLSTNLYRKLDIKFKKDSVWCLLRNIKLGKDSFYFKTHRCSLFLDKEQYEIGDTISGILHYQGLEWKYKNNWIKFKTYFRCIVGSSSNPLDYINTYPKCEGLLDEAGFGKKRNIIISSPKKKKIRQIKKL